MFSQTRYPAWSAENPGVERRLIGGGSRFRAGETVSSFCRVVVHEGYPHYMGP